MSKSLNTIKGPIDEELRVFESRFRESMRSPVPLLDKITFYIVRRKGKQVRPMFVFLAAKACGAVTDATYTAASLVELLHTATLVHDDVVDDSYERRGFFSINALWKNKIAVLVGDYLFSQGMLLALRSKQYQLLEIVSDAVKAMSEGELLQIEKARRLEFTRKRRHTEKNGNSAVFPKRGIGKIVAVAPDLGKQDDAGARRAFKDGGQIRVPRVRDVQCHEQVYNREQ